MKRGDEFVIDDFSGGRQSNVAETQIPKNAALDLDNVVVLPGGKGIRPIHGNSAFNSTTVGGAWQGLTYFLQADQTEYLVGVAGGKIYKSDSLDGTFDDVTGSLSLSSSEEQLWTLFTFGDDVIGFGGAPHAPFVWTGTGNASALGGSPPSASFGFTHNNRVFAGSTTDNPSTLYWSILGNSGDWTGSGSGAGVVGSLNDNQKLVGGIPLNVDTVLLFKQNSVYQMQARNIVSNAFPIFLLHNNVGAAGPQCIVNVNDEVFFLTPKKKMVSTAGTEGSLKEYPDVIDDVWEDVNEDALKYAVGVHYEGDDHNWLIWLVPKGQDVTRKNYAIIWDLNNKCWLTCSKGIRGNVATVTLEGTLYTGGYDGKVYEQDKAGTKTLANESSAAVSWLWRAGWLGESAFKIVQPREVRLDVGNEGGGTITLSYGFDGGLDQKTKSISMSVGPTYNGGAQYNDGSDYAQGTQMRGGRLVGRGNTFNFKISATDAKKYIVRRIAFHGKFGVGQKEQHVD